MNDEKKKVKQAVALEYDPSDEAPRVIASGKGILAEKIIEKAQESSVPIHRISSPPRSCWTCVRKTNCPFRK